jgi:hypothetical protein
VDTTVLVSIVFAVLLLLGAGVVGMRGGFSNGRIALAGNRSRPTDSAKAVEVLPRPADAAPARKMPVAPAPVLESPQPAAAVNRIDPPAAVPQPAAPQFDIAIERMQARMDARFDALERDLRARFEGVAREVGANRDAIGTALHGFDSRQAATLGHFRTELAPLLARSGNGAPLVRERRAEAAAELYALAARLESAISQVTNPVLLPGEAYAPPVDFYAEALTWENWKDVGERAFALADAFSARRLFLTEPTACAVAAFITTLRGVLTRSVYPNLGPDATPQQLDALRSAMGALAAELPRLRKALEGEFRSASGDTTTGS